MRCLMGLMALVVIGPQFITSRVAPPVVMSLSPTSGPVGSSITIIGSGFGTVQGNGFVLVNGITATVSAWSATQITITVPTGATTGPVLVDQYGVVAAAGTFTVSGGSAIACTFYFDNGATSTNAGTASNPFTTYGAMWNAVNSALISADVTVCFSATGSGTAKLEYRGSRTNTSTHIVTLDGISWKHDSPTATTWSVSTIPTSSNYDAASKYTITASNPFNSNIIAANGCMGYLTLRGFKLVGTGQIAMLMYIHDLIVEFNDLSDTSATIGPGMLISRGNQDTTTETGDCVGIGVGNIVVRWNHIHQVYGEAIYIGASQSNPTPFYANGTHIATGDNILVQENLIEDPGHFGGDNNCVDVKDGHTNTRIVRNLCYPTLNYLSGTSGSDQGIVAESGQLFDGNFIVSPSKNGLVIATSWNNNTGKAGAVLRNNIIVNMRSGVGQNTGIMVWTPTDATGDATWQAVSVYNNAIYSANDSCITFQSGSVIASGGVVKNNLCDSTPTAFSFSGGLVASHDYNGFGTSVTALGIGTCSTHTVSTETHGYCGATPLYVSTSTPYVDTNFKVTGSAVVGIGVDLSADPTNPFTNDYANATRTAPWSMGAWK